MNTLVCLLAAAMAVSAQPSQLNERTTASLTARGQTPLQCALQFGLQNRVPVGIVLSGDGSLCKSRKSIAQANGTVGRLMTEVLSGTSYTWSAEHGIVEIKPVAIPQPQASILRMKINRFGGIDTTIQGLGIILTGDIKAQLHPNEGYAGDILSSPDAETIPPFQLRDKSVEQVANYIVSLGGKGVWLLDSSEIRTFGYKEDAKALSGLTCPAPQTAPAPKSR